jgi:hypothetical protein
MDRTGFTATREGLTTPQVRGLAGVMAALDCVWHHGDCIGGDAASHVLALALRLPVELHPAAVPPHLRAFCRGATVVHPVKPPLERNTDIVTITSRLVACPSGMVEEERSGTWSTVRKARARRKLVTIVWPDGSITHEFPPADATRSVASTGQLREEQ